MKLAWSIVAAVGVIAGAATPAIADRERLVMKIEGRVVDNDRKLRVRLTGALAAGARGGGVEVTKSASTLTDVGVLLGCKLGDPDCRKQMLSSLLVDEIVSCSVSRSVVDGKLAARVSFLTRDGRIEHATVDLEGKPARQTAALEKATATLIAKAPPSRPEPPPATPIEPPPPDAAPATAPVEPPPPPDAAPPTATAPATATARENESDGPPIAGAPPPERFGAEASPVGPRDEARLSMHDIRRRSWITIGAGGGAVALGTVALVLASGKQAEIDDAPTSTVEHLDHLVELESSARWRYRVANALFVGGAITMAVGVGLAIVDMREARRRSVVVAPLVFDGGLGAALTFGGDR